ncbi:DUF4232 domain-containing protein [Actinacidiphila rubida]|uniref:DUF4232 domain-containing protein n=1 Tax=Actinacidiphila rubida TaxID=310780 RepID=A0A1H8LNM4_9ACTN|nr:DUF4232 domain-containing protein [Actinacidiphila rubida]SEO06448.1 Protein of unknown function [Actinacidiphila rubida]
MGTSTQPGSASARRTRPLLAAGAVTLLAVAATACGNGGPPRSASSSSLLPPGTSASAAASPSPSSPESATPAPPSATSGPPQPAPTAAGSASAPAARASGTPGSRCTVTGLRMRLGTPDHGAGSVYYPLRFTNTGSRTCTLDGYPGVSLIRGDGSTIGRPADRTPPHGTTVEVAPGQTVEADLHTLNQGIKGGSCWRRPTFLLVYPPGSTASMSLATSSPLVCGGTFEVGAVH